MGCASSTPMVATAGSEILKAATHVADDAKNTAEGAVEEVSQALGKTIDTAKDTVGNAVAGITNELGNTLKEPTDALDEAKDKAAEKLHMSDVAAEVVAKEHDARLEQLSRGGTPNANADADSLKTSTPEPEIEQALANRDDDDEENPPTPKPTLAELAHLSAEAATIAAVTAVSVEHHPAVAAASAPAPAATSTEAPSTAQTVDKKAATANNEGELRRPGTTDWEKFADMLAHNRKFKPYEAFAQNVNQFSVYQDYTRLKDIPGPHYDGSFSDVTTSSNTLTSLSQSSLSSPHFHHTPATLIVPPATVLVPPVVTTAAAAAAISKKVYQRDFASLVACEQPGSVSRLSNRSTTSLGRQFDYNPNRERVSLPIVSSSTTHLGAMVSAAAAAAVTPIVLGKSGGSWARQPSDGSLGGQQTPQPLPLKLGTVSRLSQSSSNSSGGVVIRSNFTTPSTMSPTLTLPSLGKCAEEEAILVEDRVVGVEPAVVDIVPGEVVPLKSLPSSGTATPTPSLLRRSRTPSRRASNTSSFLSSPRVSPFTVRKDYADKENKATFITELSSVTPKRVGTKVPLSPYRIRERCDVCYNKYVIQ